MPREAAFSHDVVLSSKPAPSRPRPHPPDPHGRPRRARAHSGAAARPDAPSRGARRMRRRPRRVLVLRRGRARAACRPRAVVRLRPVARRGRAHHRYGGEHRLSAVAHRVHAGGGRARRGPPVAMGPRDSRRRRRRHHRGLPHATRLRPAARPGHQGARVDLDARLRRLRRSRRADDADQRRDRVHRRPVPSSLGPRAAHLARRRHGRGHGGRLPYAPRRRAIRRRSPPSRRLRDRGARPVGPGERRRVLGLHLDLRRVDALRARGKVPVRSGALAALCAARRRRLPRRVALPLVAPVRSTRRRSPAWTPTGASPRSAV